MDDMESRREAERVKYAEILKRWPRYGDKNHGSKAGRYVIDVLKPSTIIDVGCGGNQFAHSMRAAGIPATGVDIANPRADVIAPAHDLPYDDKAFDLLTAFDVLEHLLEDEVRDVLNEWSHVSRRYLVSIAFFPHVHHGVNLHMTVKPAGWWVEMLQEFGTVEDAPIPCPKDKKRYLTGVWR